MILLVASVSHEMRILIKNHPFFYNSTHFISFHRVHFFHLFLLFLMFHIQRHPLQPYLLFPSPSLHPPICHRLHVFLRRHLSCSTWHISEWQHAIIEELATLDWTGTWHIVPSPTHVVPIICKWIFKVKTKFDGSSTIKLVLWLEVFSRL